MFIILTLRKSFQICKFNIKILQEEIPDKTSRMDGSVMRGHAVFPVSSLHVSLFFWSPVITA